MANRGGSTTPEAPRLLLRRRRGQAGSGRRDTASRVWCVAVGHTKGHKRDTRHTKICGHEVRKKYGHDLCRYILCEGRRATRGSTRGPPEAFMRAP